MPQGVPEVARCEDFDSDENSVRPGTRKEAKRRSTTSSRPPKALDRHRGSVRDGTSDSGYSSHTSGTRASTSRTQQSAAMPPPPRPAIAQTQSRSKPVIHRSESQRSSSKTASAASRPTGQCADASCRHPGCIALKYPERRSSISQQYSPTYAPQYAASPAGYPQTPQSPQYQYQYAQVPQATATQTVPTSNTQSRSRSGSASRQARPASIHGYPSSGSYNGGTQGPPPSASAYHNMYAAWAQAYQQQQLQLQQQQQQAYQRAAAYGTTPPTPTTPIFPQASPVQTSFPALGYGGTAAPPPTYSARTTNLPAGYNVSATQAQHQVTSTRVSARQPSTRAAMPGAYISSESESEESNSDMSEEEYERERRSRARDSRQMSSSSSRRPSLRRHYPTAPIVPTRSSREILHRNLYSETGLGYISSSDNMDSDRTARAVVERPRTSYTGSSRSSRRPSVSTTASSGRTKATTISSATSGFANMVLEDTNGRKITYLSKRDQDAAMARAREYTREQAEAEAQRKRQDEIEAYQDVVRGAPVPELTAENIRQQQLRRNGSVSGHSRRSSRASSKAHNSEGVKIESNGAIIHVYGGSRVEMRPGEDGVSASFVIGSASGRDSAYHSGSKSSSSRVGRSRGGSDIGVKRRDTIREEVGYEQPAI